MARMGFIQDEMDLKLLVLYIMARIAAPITFLQLLELALCDAGVDYFSLTQAVEHLVETEHLSREGERYAITEKGRRNSWSSCSASRRSGRRRREAQRPGTREKNPVKHILGFSFCIYMYIMDLDEKSEPRRRGPERKIGTEGPSDGGITQ